RAELASASNRVARGMAALGVGPGAMVTIGLPNGIATFIGVVAAWKLGAVPQPVSAKLPEAELTALVEIADPAVVLGLEPADGRPWMSEAQIHEAAGDPGLSDEPLPPVTPPSWKAPTSGGSTGRPKIIVAGGEATVEVITARTPALRIEPDGTMLVTAPLYHNAPF